MLFRSDKKFKKDPSELQKIGRSIIKYKPYEDKEKYGEDGMRGETTIEGDTSNTAKGKGGNFSFE